MTTLICQIASITNSVKNKHKMHAMINGQANVRYNFQSDSLELRKEIIANLIKVGVPFARNSIKRHTVAEIPP